MFRIGRPNDFWAGLLFMAFGVAALVLSRKYAMGDAVRMGPGYFPRALGALLLILGAALSVRAIRAPHEPADRFRPRPLVIILGSLAIFCAALKWLGLVVSGILLIFLASLASSEFRWREALLSGVIQGACAVALFIYGLKIPLSIWPAFVGAGS